MKALTLWQPWATLVALGVKTVETRSWAAPKALIGHRLAIHAAKSSPGYGWLGSEDAEWRYEPHCMGRVVDGQLAHMQYDLPRGAVVAVARLVACVPIIANDDCEWDGADEPLTPCAHGAIDDQVIIHTPGADSHTTVLVERPYGDYTPGRFAWVLDDIETPTNPVPATGRQGLWNWTPA